MITFRVLVAEDEPLAREMATTLLRRDAEIGEITECGDAESVRAALQNPQPYDIAFLDVEMPGATGIEIARAAGAKGPLVVFVTAFHQYASTAFDVNAVDYVVKPFSNERFFAALTRAKRRVRERRLGDLAGQLAPSSAETSPVAPSSSAYLTRLPCREEGRAVLLSTADVVWIEAEDYYVKVHAKQSHHLIRVTLSSLGGRLDPNIFQRVHRTAIVNVREVIEVREEDRWILVMSNGARVPVSRSRRAQVEPVIVPRLRKR